MALCHSLTSTHSWCVISSLGDNGLISRSNKYTAKDGGLLPALMVDLVSPCLLRWIIGSVSMCACVSLFSCDNGITFKCKEPASVNRLGMVKLHLRVG